MQARMNVACASKWQHDNKSKDSTFDTEPDLQVIKCFQDKRLG